MSIIAVSGSRSLYGVHMARVILSWGIIHRSFLVDGTQDKDLTNFVISN